MCTVMLWHKYHIYGQYLWYLLYLLHMGRHHRIGGEGARPKICSLLASPHAASPRPPRNLHLPRRALLLPTADALFIWCGLPEYFLLSVGRRHLSSSHGLHPSCVAVVLSLYLWLLSGGFPSPVTKARINIYQGTAWTLQGPSYNRTTRCPTTATSVYPSTKRGGACPNTSPNPPQNDCPSLPSVPRKVITRERVARAKVDWHPRENSSQIPWRNCSWSFPIWTDSLSNHILVGRSQRVLRRINCRWVLVSSSLEFGLFFSILAQSIECKMKLIRLTWK